MRARPLLIGIALGDPTGIGPEVTLKALAAESSRSRTRYLLLGDTRQLRRLNQELQLHLPLVESRAARSGDRLLLDDPRPQPLPARLAPGSPLAGQASLAWLRAGAEGCLRGELAALVTAPVNKAAIIRGGEVGFTGQTEWLARLAKAPRHAMMLLGTDARGRWLRVALVTTHLPLKEVAGRLTRARITEVIALTVEACRQLGLARARVGVCGVNPHAGEEGHLGSEERAIIQPAVRAARRRHAEIAGPLAADTLFHYAYRGEYDAVVAMYHDQGLAPLKMVAFATGVNWTLGLPFIRTSPDHGTAYDIAGQGRADPGSMRAALNLACQLARGADTFATPRD